MKLYSFQEKVLEETRDLNKVAYYLDMGLGKTFVGAEKAISLVKNILVICQKSKVKDWIEHFTEHYELENDLMIYDLTKWNKKDWLSFGNDPSFKNDWHNKERYVLVINYELAFRRPELSRLKDFTLMLDESSMIQNETAKRSKFILNKLYPDNVILLSGTPTSGKYERLWSQLHLLGWEISKDLYWRQYVDFEYQDKQGFPIKIVKGYKNVERLKSKLRNYGAVFMKTDEVFDLPDQIFNDIKIDTTKEYRTFKKKSIVTIGEKELVGDTILTKMLYERMLCGQYNDEKINALMDLLESTEDRVIIFYNFNEELRIIEDVCLELDKPLSIVNGQEKDLTLYDEYDNSVTAIQYQAGAMGLNLQKANRVIYFTPTLSSELFEQSKKRIHRIGQNSTCFYYMLTCKDSIEERIYATLKMRRDYTNDLFEEDEKRNKKNS